MSDIIYYKDRNIGHHIVSDPEHVLYDLLPQQIQRVSLRNGDHNLMFPKVSTERYKNSLINRCLSLFSLTGYFFRKNGLGLPWFPIIPIYVHSSPF